VIDQQLTTVQVSDGQLTVTGGRDGRINGLVVREPVPVPAALTADVDAAQDPRVSLTWGAVAGATGYRLYRSTETTEREILAETSEPVYVDTDVMLGEPYSYAVRALAGERQSLLSEAIEVSVVDADVASPAAPTGLEVLSITRNEIALSWNADADTDRWRVYRTTRADIPFSLVATTTEPTWRDADVLTTRAFFYRVVAVNAGGYSAPSESLETEVTTTLVREVEYLDRAPVAVALDEGVYVGWRLLGLDDRSLAFNVYRDGVKANDEPLAGATNFVDAAGTVQSRYRVFAIVDGHEVGVTDEFGTWEDQYLDIPVDKPADGVSPTGEAYRYAPGDASVGDLDGDGTYEIVLLWNPSNAQDNSIAGHTGNAFLDAYSLDGTRLWRIDLGVNIRAGAHYTQFQVYDLDGDGRAEVAFKTADGTIDGIGEVIGDPDADHRNADGYVLSGPEFLTVFDGLTGAALDTVDYKPGRGDVGSWGDTYGNRVDRFLAGVGYFDGERPSLVFSRGYYTRSVLVAWDFRDGRLTERWTFDSDDWGAQYEGQGNHQLTTADVDRDGLDEVVYGALTIDHDGTPLYNSRLLHGDVLHVGDHVIERPGLEIFSTFENPAENGGVMAAMRDAETGEVLWKTEGPFDTGRGSVADIDPNHPGAEAWHPASSAIQTTDGPVKTAHGEVISIVIPEATFVAHWDGDPLRELVSQEFDSSIRAGVPLISKWNPETNTPAVLYRAEGVLSQGTQAQPLLQADLFGDWREELLFRHVDGNALRLLTTVDPTEQRIPTLMHDSQYRQAVAWQNTAYNQPPHTSYFIGADMEEPPLASIRYVGAPVGDATPPEISGLPSGTYPDSAQITLGILAEDAESGIRSVTIELDGETIDPAVAIDLSGRIGDHTLVVTAVNNAGLTATAESEFLVLRDDGAAAAPGVGTLSHTSGWAYGLHDGNYDVVMNLWWGTPGSLVRIYENGALIATKALPATAGLSQTAGITVAGKPNGSYVYTAELINLKGATSTTSTTVTVNAAHPGTPVLSHDNWDGDGDFRLTANLWWGTNASAYRFELDGEVVSEGSLTSRTPSAQHAFVDVTGIAPGDHTARVVFVNAVGEATSAPVSIRVTR